MNNNNEMNSIRAKEERSGCVRSVFFKAGLPIAALGTVYGLWLEKMKLDKTGAELRFSMPRFITNSVLNFAIGIAASAQYCYLKIQQPQFFNERLQAEQAQTKEEVTEEHGSALLRNDEDYESNLNLNLDATGSNYSHLNLDGQYSGKIQSQNVELQDEEIKSSKTLSNTYDNLRRQNRTNFVKSYIQSTFRDDYKSSEALSSSSANQKLSTDDVQTKKIKKNKYGDEVVD